MTFGTVGSKFWKSQIDRIVTFSFFSLYTLNIILSFVLSYTLRSVGYFTDKHSLREVFQENPYLANGCSGMKFSHSYSYFICLFCLFSSLVVYTVSNMDG